MIAKIIVDNKSKQVDKPFDYLVPKELEGKIKIGHQHLKLLFRYDALLLLPGMVFGFPRDNSFQFFFTISWISMIMQKNS